MLKSFVFLFYRMKNVPVTWIRQAEWYANALALKTWYKSTQKDKNENVSIASFKVQNEEKTMKIDDYSQIEILNMELSSMGS